MIERHCQPASRVSLHASYCGGWGRKFCLSWSPTSYPPSSRSPITYILHPIQIPVDANHRLPSTLRTIILAGSINPFSAFTLFQMIRQRSEEKGNRRTCLTSGFVQRSRSYHDARYLQLLHQTLQFVDQIVIHKGFTQDLRTVSDFHKQREPRSEGGVGYRCTGSFLRRAMVQPVFDRGQEDRVLWVMIGQCWCSHTLYVNCFCYIITCEIVTTGTVYLYTLPSIILGAELGARKSP